MTRFDRLVAAVALVACGAHVAFAVHPTTERQLLAMALLLALAGMALAAIGVAIGDWRKRGWRVLLPLAICAVSPILGAFLGRTASDALFRRDLPGYESVVQRIESDPSLRSAVEMWLPDAAEALAVESVRAERTGDGTLYVEFTVGGGFPVKHTAYLYTSTGAISPGARMDKRWPFRRAMTGRWYLVEN